MTTEELRSRAKVFAHRCVKLAAALPVTALGRIVRGEAVGLTRMYAASRKTCAQGCR